MMTPSERKFKWLEENKNYTGPVCLIWPFTRRKDGYADRIGGGDEREYPYRIMCKLVNGDAPANKPEAAHNCGNGTGGCVTPNHLRWASRQENIDDAIAHGTYIHGERHHAAKLTKDQVLSIKRSKKKGVELARKFNVCCSTISRIRSGVRWSHIS